MYWWIEGEKLVTLSRPIFRKRRRGSKFKTHFRVLMLPVRNTRLFFVSSCYKNSSQKVWSQSQGHGLHCLLFFGVARLFSCMLDCTEVSDKKWRNRKRQLRHKKAGIKSRESKAPSSNKEWNGARNSSKRLLGLALDMSISFLLSLFFKGAEGEWFIIFFLKELKFKDISTCNLSNLSPGFDYNVLVRMKMCMPGSNKNLGKKQVIIKRRGFLWWKKCSLRPNLGSLLKLSLAAEFEKSGTFNCFCGLGKMSHIMSSPGFFLIIFYI